ncbi:unnamed protein product [Moneuplotes crassus]|uniref:Uncharacterized protein n=1 Tax=Euplotes crassus TaxID=5936 RepID=A0AAD1U9U6_EUPCR|nr:unnamed protein product [Moneuplotes crassus]
MALAEPYVIEEQILHFRNIHNITYINYDTGESKADDSHNWEVEEVEPPSILDRFVTNNVPVKKTIRLGHLAGEDNVSEEEHSKKGSLSIQSKTSLFKRDLKLKGINHLTKKFAPIQKPVVVEQEDPEDLFTTQMRVIKIKEYELEQQEIKKAKDVRRKLLAKSRAAALKNEEKLLAKRAYTYNYDGEIIFVKPNNNDRMPQTLSQPRIRTKLKPMIKTSQETIHNIKRSNLSQDEIVQKHFKPTPTQESEKLSKKKK